MKRVVIDPGHGGWDKGATPIDIHNGGYYEATFNWRLSKAIGDHLLANYVADIIYTHEGDHTALDPKRDLVRELADRSHVANQAKADLLVSIHHDSTGNQEVRGGSLWIWADKNGPLSWHPALGNHTDPKTFPIALRMVKPVREALAALGVPWRWWGDPQGLACANFGILRNTQGPALLVEAFHGSSPEDVAAARKPEFIPALAIAIAESIADALNLDEKVTVPPPNRVTVLVDGKVVECNAHIINGRTEAQVAPIVAAMGGTFAWDGEKRVLSIRSPRRSTPHGVHPV
jgi:N-acetylmuramoyl-L-alanine amidase